MSASLPGPAWGAILAGGRGQRMGGQDKGWVGHRGAPLVSHVLERLRPQVASVVVSANRSFERYRALGCEVVDDGEDARDEGGGQGGPLAGMIAVLEFLGKRAHEGRVIFVPCDAPHLPEDLVARLVAAAPHPSSAAVAVCEGRWQPVFCLLPVRALGALREAFSHGERRPETALRALGAVPVEFTGAASFTNINVPQDPA
jgi:molybdopterin-guanine dinucleotide biosynthesis protein A